MSTFAASLRASQVEKIKISTPGIYTRFSISNAEKIENNPQRPFFKFTFESSSGEEYTDLALFIKKEDFVQNGKVVITKKKAEDDILIKLMEICDAIGTQGEIDKFLSGSYEDNLIKLFGYIQKQRTVPNRFVNIKVIMDNKDEWTKMPEYAGSATSPNIQKWIDGKENSIKFTQREIDKNLNRRVKPRDTSGYTGSKAPSDSSSLGMPAEKPKDFRIDAPLTEAERADLPF